MNKQMSVGKQKKKELIQEDIEATQASLAWMKKYAMTDSQYAMIAAREAELTRLYIQLAYLNDKN